MRPFNGLERSSMICVSIECLMTNQFFRESGETKRSQFFSFTLFKKFYVYYNLLRLQKRVPYCALSYMKIKKSKRFICRAIRTSLGVRKQKAKVERKELIQLPFFGTLLQDLHSCNMEDDARSTFNAPTQNSFCLPFQKSI